MLAMIVVPSYERCRHVGDRAPADPVCAIELRFDDHRRRARSKGGACSMTAISRRQRHQRRGEAQQRHRSADAGRAAENQRHFVADAERVARVERVEGQRHRGAERDRHQQAATSAAERIAAIARIGDRDRRRSHESRAGQIDQSPRESPRTRRRLSLQLRIRHVEAAGHEPFAGRDAKLMPMKKITVATG